MKYRKLIAAVTIVAIVISTVVATGYVFAQDRPTVYSSVSGEISAGDEISIPVLIRDNNGLMGFMLEFSYDADIITPTSVDYGEAISGGLQDNIDGDAEPGRFKVYWSGNANLVQDGVMLYINANVNEAAVGSTSISIDYNQADTFDENFKDVELNCESIELNVINNNFSQYARITSRATDAIAGDNVSVTLSISDISNVSNINLNLSFAFGSFYLFSVETISPDVCYSINGDTIEIDVYDVTSELNNEDFITLVFRSGEKTKSGTYTFNVSSEEEGIFCKSCSTTISPSATSEIAQISIPQGIAIEKNEVAEIPVMISNNNGIMGYRLTFDYNPDEIEVLSVKGSNHVSGDVYDSIGDKPSSFDVLWNDSNEFSTDGLLFSIEVKNISNSVKESAIDISYSQQDTFNEKYEDVVFDCQSGTITLCPEHSYIQQTVQPTCTGKGYTEYVCENCSNTYKTDFIDELGHYYHYTGNRKDFEMTYECADCGEELSIYADEVYDMWDSYYLNIRPNSIENRTKTDNSSLLNVIPDGNADDGIINGKDYGLIMQLTKSYDND